MGSKYEIFENTINKLSDKRYEFESSIEQLENKAIKMQREIEDLKVIEQRMEFYEKRLAFLESLLK